MLGSPQYSALDSLLAIFTEGFINQSLRLPVLLSSQHLWVPQRSFSSSHSLFRSSHRTTAVAPRPGPALHVSLSLTHLPPYWFVSLFSLCYRLLWPQSWLLRAASLLHCSRFLWLLCVPCFLFLFFFFHLLTVFCT